MWRYALALSLLAGSVSAQSVNGYFYGPVASGGGGGGTSGTAMPVGQVAYGNGTGITSDPSLTYSAGTLMAYGFTNNGPVIIDAANTGSIQITGNSGLGRGLNIYDAATNVAKIIPAGSNGGLTFASNIGNVGAVFRTVDSANNQRGYSCYVGLGNSSGCMFSGLGYTTPSATIHVSGTARVTGLMAVGANVTATTALDVYGTGISTTLLKVSNALTASTTQILYVSGSAVDGANGINYDPSTDFTGFGATPPVNSFTPSSTIDVSGTMRVTGANVACTASNNGAIRRVTTLQTIAVCFGTSWYALASTTTVVAPATN